MAYPKFKRGAHAPKGLKPEVVEQELQRIYDQSGGILEARTLWTESADEDAPLHSAFTWDDSVAGPLWRDQEARGLIRCVSLAEDPQSKAGRKGWVHVTVGDVSGYQPTVVAMANPDTRAQVIGEAREDLAAARRRLADLEGSVKAVKAVDAAMVEVANMA